MKCELRATAARALLGICLWACGSGISAPAHGQTLNAGPQPVHFQVSKSVDRLDMIVNTSRILTTEHKIPRLLVENQSIVRAQPISPNQVQLSAVKAGFTTLTVWDEKDTEHTIDVLVYGDARELENLLATEFPEASLRVRPLATSVVITGYVPRADMVSRIVRMAEDYYPSVINNISIGGGQQVLLHVKLMEVSRTKLRRLGFDWANFNADDSIVQHASGLINAYSLTPGAQAVTTARGETVAFGIVNDANSFFGFIDALRQYNLVKVLAEPTLVTVSGRPASFSSGGEFPILVPQSLGTLSIEYRQFGTRVDFVPIVLGNGRIRLEVRPQVSEVDPSRSVTINSTTVPGLRTRWVDTGVEMKAGQTLALAGLIQNQIEAQNRGIPYLADLPWIGNAFRHVQEQNNEIELLVLVTPEFVEALDPEEVPPCGPGQLTTSPDDVDLYLRGYLEVPMCCDDGSCANCQRTGYFDGYPAAGGGYEHTPEPLTAQPISTSSPATGTIRDSRAPQVPGRVTTPTPASGGSRSSSATPPPTLIGPSGYDMPR